MSFIPTECRLFHILFSKRNSMIFICCVQNIEYSRAPEFINDVIDLRKRTIILDRNRIKWPVVDTNSKLSIRFPHRNCPRTPRTFGWLQYSQIQKFLYLLIYFWFPMDWYSIVFSTFGFLIPVSIVCSPYVQVWFG